MEPSPSAVPRTPDGPTWLDRRVRLRTLTETPLASALQWRCLHDDDVPDPERYHTTWVVKLTRVGSSRLHAAGRRVAMDSGLAAVYPPEVPYRSSHPEGCRDVGVSLALRRDVGDRLVERIAPGLPRDRPLLVPAAGRELAMLRRLIAIAGAVEPLEAEERILDTFTSLLEAGAASRHRDDTPTGRHHRRVVDRTRDYLRAHFATSIRIDRVAREVGASPAHLSRIFKAHAGVSIGRYLTQLRVAAALELLGDRGRPLADVALETGFCSHSHLTTVFTRECGAPPARVRESSRIVEATEHAGA